MRPAVPGWDLPDCLRTGVQNRPYPGRQLLQGVWLLEERRLRTHRQGVDVLGPVARSVDRTRPLDARAGPQPGLIGREIQESYRIRCQNYRYGTRISPPPRRVPTLASSLHDALPISLREGVGLSTWSDVT